MKLDKPFNKKRFIHQLFGCYKIAFTLSLSLLFLIPNLHAFQKETISQKLTTHLPQEKVYLHTDKPFYAAGETIWFKAYLRNAINHSANTPSKLVYADFINPAGEVLIRRVLKTENGSAPAEILLPDSLEMGQYKLRAYTHYMRNFPPEYFFEKTIPVYTKNYSSSGDLIALDPQDLDVQFFPEGGQFVAGLPATIAFKVMRPNGQSADVSGYIVDNKKDTVMGFSTLKYGHGKVTFVPEERKRYKAVFDYKINYYEFDLPKAEKEGYTLSIVSQKNNAITGMIRSKTEMNVVDGLIVGQIRGIPVFELEVGSGKEFKLFSFPTGNLPPGILQVTYFSKDNVPQCERLVFIEENERAKVELNLGKGNYNPREEVNLSLKLRDQWEGADCSLTVVDGEKVVNAAFQNDIRTHLLLTSDLKGNIEDPGYYFYSQDSLRSEALDLVMMTHGWRRFIWREVLKEEDKDNFLLYVPEETHVVEGLLRKYRNINAPVKGKVTLTGTNPLLEASLVTDETGRFRFFGVDYPDSAEFILQSFDLDKKGGEKKDFAIYPSLRKAFPIEPWIPFSKYKEEGKSNDKDFGIYKIRESLMREDSSLIVLEEIEIEGNKKLTRYTKKTKYNENTAIIRKRLTIDSVSESGYAINSIIKMSDITFERTLSGLIFPQVNGRATNRMINNINYPDVVERINYMNEGELDFVDILDAPVPGSLKHNFIPERWNLPTIAIYTRKEPLSYKPKPRGHAIIVKPGYYQVRQFYSPKYDQKKEVESDHRTTLHWQPNIIFDNSGNAEVSFYNSDGEGLMEVFLEGVTNEGTPIREKVSYYVRQGNLR